MVVGDVVVTSGIDGIYPEGVRHRAGRVGREERRRLPAHHGQAGGRFSSHRGSAGGADAAAGARGRRRDRPSEGGGVILATVAVALALQTTLARLVVRGTVAVDLVLVVVVYVALTSGPATGLLTGTFAGLVQDALSSGGDRHRRAGEDDCRVPRRHHRHAVHRRAAAAAVRGVFRRDRGPRDRVHGAVHPARTCGSLVRRMRRSPVRRRQRRDRGGGISAGRASAWSGGAAQRRSAPGSGARHFLMAAHEERRRITIRLSRPAVRHHGGVLGPGRELLGAPGRRSTRSSRRWPRTTTSGRSRFARRAGLSSTGTADPLVRTGTRTASRSSASTPRT